MTVECVLCGREITCNEPLISWIFPRSHISEALPAHPKCLFVLERMGDKGTHVCVTVSENEFADMVDSIN